MASIEELEKRKNKHFQDDKCNLPGREMIG